LVSEVSARKSFPFENFRFGTIVGYTRIFNRADWINLQWGDSRLSTGEVCSLALAKMEGAQTRVSLMDVPSDSGVEGFLHRESTYDIWEVPFVDDNGTEGIALACGECTDEQMKSTWGESNWYITRCTGRISYVDAVPNTPIPLIPAIQVDSTTFTDGNPALWLPFTNGSNLSKYNNPDRPWVYPSPGYMRLVYRAYARSNPDLVKNFLEFTFLMDRKTNLMVYLDANPLLKDYITDPKHHPEWTSDRYG